MRPSLIHSMQNAVRTAISPLPSRLTQQSTSSNSPRKQIITLTPRAVDQVKLLAKQDCYLRIGVLKKGCSGLQYSLEYVKQKHKFDEQVIQDDVCVLIETKAMFTILGSEMDYVKDKLSSQFVFNNPNVKESCGCGQSFMV